MSSCPNINLPEWKTLEESVGTFEAYRDFMETDGMIRTPEEVQAKLREKDNYQLIRLGEDLNATSYDQIKKLTARIAEKFADNEYVLEERPDAPWKGKVELRDGKRVVVINTSSATLDTPLHEFGHIFIDMIRKANQNLYGKLVMNIERNHQDLLAEITELYGDQYSDVEIIEEAIVELLGRMAAGKIDPNTTEYNLIMKLWEAIVAKLKKMFGANGNLIDVAYIADSATIGDLADMLASDAEITIGTALKEQSALSIIPELRFKIDQNNRFLRKNPNPNETHQKSIDFVNGQVQIVNKDNFNVAMKFRGGNTSPGQIGGPLRNLYEYVDDGSLLNDAKNLYEEIKGASGESTFDLSKRLQKKYLQLFTAVKLTNDPFGGLDPEFYLSEMLSTPDHGNLTVLDDNYSRALTGIRELKVSFIDRAESYKHAPASFYSDVFSNAYNWQSVLEAYGFNINIERSSLKLPISASDRMLPITDIINNTNKKLEEQIKDIEANPLQAVDPSTGTAKPISEKKVEYDVLNPKTGVVEKETVTIQAGFSGERIGDVIFKSTIFGYGDAYALSEFPDKAFTKESLYWSDPAVVFTFALKTNPGDYRLFDETSTSYILRDESNVGVEESVIKNPIPGATFYTENVPYTDSYGNQLTERIDLIRIPKTAKSLMRIVKPIENRGQIIMSEVMQTISELNYFNNAKYIKFQPVYKTVAGGPKGQISRAGLYQMSAQRTYGKYHRVKFKEELGGETVTYGELQDMFKALTNEEKEAKRVSLMKSQRRNATKIRLKKYNFAAYMYDVIDVEKVLIPKNFQSGFMAPLQNKPLYQLKRKGGNPQMSENPSLAEIAEATQGRSEDTTITSDQLKNTKGIEIANKMSNMLGIDYEMVSESDATEITKDAANPWNGEPAFYFGGKVYFIANRMNSEMAFHEFAHPIIRHIAKTNAKQLDGLYTQLESTPEGQVIIQYIRDNYSELEEGTPRFKEEAIVKTIAADANYKMGKLKTPSGLLKIIKDIFYAIKQSLRKVFGRTLPLSKIDSVTTLGDLSDILVKGEKIEINTEVFSDEELVAYSREDYKEINSQLENIDEKDIRDTVNSFYDKISTQLNILMSNEKYDELAELLTDPYQRGDLQAMKGNLQQYQTAVTKIAEDFRTDVNESKSRVEALSNTLFRLESVMTKVYDHIQEISKYPDTKDNMHKAYHYDSFLKYYDAFLDDFKKVLDKPDNNVPNRSPIVNLTEDTMRKLRQSRLLINDMYAKGARDAVYEQMEPINRTIRDRYEKMIKKLEDKGASQERLDVVYREYHGMTKAQYDQMGELLKRDKAGNLSINEKQLLDNLLTASQKGLSVSKDKIEQLLKGNMGDANWFNSYLEGYLYNTDPIVGGLALYTKNALNDMMIVSQKKFNTFAETMRPLLEAAGYNPNKIGDFGEKVGFKDKVAKWNRETGEIEEKEVWSFINKFKNYRYDEDRLAHAVTEAQKQYAGDTNDANKKVLINAVAEQKKWQKKHMNQEYVDEFYERHDAFEKDDIGKEAAHRREEFFERLRKLTEPAKSQSDQMLIADELQDMWRDYRQMHSRFDLNGKLKKGDEAVIAERLTAFRNDSREFYEWKARKGVFENAYFDFKQELLAEGVDDAEYEVRMAAWKTKNSRKVIKPEWYDERTRILNRIKEIIKESNLPDNEKASLDQGKVWEDIISLADGFRDDDNQIIGTDISDDSRAKMKDLQERLIEMKKEGVKNNGLTEIETERFYALLKKKKSKGRLDREDYNELQKLYDLKNTLGMSDFALAELNGLYAELGELSDKEATPYYVDMMNNWLSKLDTSLIFDKWKMRNVTTSNVDNVMTEEVVKDLKSQNADFAKWFDSNHIEETYSEKVPGFKKYIKKKRYSRLYAWSVVKPSDPSMMESYDIKNKEGEVVDTIEGLPSMDYYARVVKNKYKTRRVMNETVDNRGRFLPKAIQPAGSTYINEKYEEMKQSDPALFNAMEKMKEFHLKHQEGLSYKSRLYLDFPRFQKEGLEIMQSTKVNEYGEKKWNALSQYVQRAKDWLYGEKSQSEEGFSYNEDFNLVRADVFDNDVTSVPIAGLFDLTANEVTTDVTQSMMRYMLSAERQKQLVKISPVVRAIQNTLKNPENAINDLNRVNEAEFKNRGLLKYLPKKDNVRLAAVNNLIEREFEGMTQKGLGADVPWMNNFANLLFKRASFSFFALNLPSALKNSLGMKFQEMIEASGGEYVDHTTLQKGNAFAYKAMGELSFSGELYKKGAKSHMQQLVEVFDMIQGKFEEKFGENMSRTMVKDAAEISWLYSPRKWVENQAAIQLGAGMLYKRKVTITDDNGDTSEIPYIEAFETVDGQIKLKDGIDIRYGLSPTKIQVEAGDTFEKLADRYNIPREEIDNVFGNVSIDQLLENIDVINQERTEALEELDPLDSITDPNEKSRMMDRIAAINNKFDKKLDETGRRGGSIQINNSEFKFMKNRMQQVANNMGGAYSKFDQPEAQRYLAFRFISYLRRYFTTMFVNRWGFSGSLWDPKPRLNPGLGDVQMGFYIQFYKVVKEAIQTGGKNFAFLTDSEKAGMLKMLAEVVMLGSTTILMAAIFGWDPEDDERYKKLRAMSGAAPFPFAPGDKDREFDALGYAEVHALHMLMQVRGENEQFNLLFGGIKNYNSLLDIKSVAFGPTTDSYVQLWEDTKMIATGDPKAYYSRDVGPYSWQKKGGSKFMTHFAKTLGLTGSSLDPALAIQNFQSYQSKVKR